MDCVRLLFLSIQSDNFVGTILYVVHLFSNQCFVQNFQSASEMRADQSKGKSHKLNAI